MGVDSQSWLMLFAALVALIFVAGIVYTMTQFRRMDARPTDYEGSDPETHYRR